MIYGLLDEEYKSSEAQERLRSKEKGGVVAPVKGNILLLVAYTERQGHIRIISARRTMKQEQDHYFRQNS